MADTQGASGVGGDDRSPPRDLRKGSADDWGTTLDVVQRAEIAERGGVASQFFIRDNNGSPAPPDGPSQPHPRRSTHTRTQPQILGLEAPPSPTAQPRPRRAAPTATPISTCGKKRTREPSAAESSSEQPRDDAHSDSSGPEAPPPIAELKRASTRQVWCYRLRKYENCYPETRETPATHLGWTEMQWSFLRAMNATHIKLFTHRVLNVESLA